MNETAARLDAFIEQWHEPLAQKTDVFFHSKTRDEIAFAPANVANLFVAECGFASIGHHWEMLDILATPQGARSARGAFVDALSKDLSMKSDWLGAARALKCAEQFIGAFEPAQATVLTNHIVRKAGESEAWNPISKAELEWAFVGYDDSAIALLVLTAQD